MLKKAVPRVLPVASGIAKDFKQPFVISLKCISIGAVVQWLSVRTITQGL